MVWHDAETSKTFRRGWAWPPRGACSLARNALFSALGVTLLFCLPAFGAQRWEQHYGWGAEDGNGVALTRDGGYVVAAQSLTLGGGSETVAWLIKTDSLGDTTWTRTFRPPTAGTSWFNSVATLDDNGYAMAGSADFLDSTGQGVGGVFVVRTDSLGDTCWTRIVGANRQGSRAWSIKQTPDGGLVVAGDNPEEAGFYIVRFDSLGDTLWTRRLFTDSGGVAYHIELTQDNGFIAAGCRGNSACLVRLNEQGETLWTRTYNGSDWSMFLDVRVLSDSGFIAAGAIGINHAGHGYLVRTDPWGNVVWTKAYGGGYGDDFVGVAPAGDGGFMVAGITWSFGAGGKDVWLVKTAASGDTEWMETFGGPYDDWACGIESTPDSGCIVVGVTESYLYGMDQVYLIKTDAYGSATAIKQDPEANPLQGSAGPRLSIPTIAAGGSDAEYYLPEPGIARLELFNALGQDLARLAEGRMSAGLHRAGLPSGLPAGSYFLRLRTGQGNATQRFLLVK
jgi:hypothetical protein